MFGRTKGIRGLCVAMMLAAAVSGFGSVSAAEGKSSGRAGAASAEGEAKTAVDLNKAGADELAGVPGIGDSIARRIVEFREKNGPYRSVDDLLKVQGIGEKSLQKLRPYLTVEKSR